MENQEEIKMHLRKINDLLTQTPLNMKSIVSRFPPVINCTDTTITFTNPNELVMYEEEIEEIFGHFEPRSMQKHYDEYGKFTHTVICTNINSIKTFANAFNIPIDETPTTDLYELVNKYPPIIILYDDDKDCGYIKLPTANQKTLLIDLAPLLEYLAPYMIVDQIVRDSATITVQLRREFVKKFITEFKIPEASVLSKTG